MYICVCKFVITPTATKCGAKPKTTWNRERASLFTRWCWKRRSSGGPLFVKYTPSWLFSWFSPSSSLPSSYLTVQFLLSSPLLVPDCFYIYFSFSLPLLVRFSIYNCLTYIYRLALSRKQLLLCSLIIYGKIAYCSLQYKYVKCIIIDACVILFFVFVVLCPLRYYYQRHPVNLILLGVFTFALSFSIGLTCAYTSGMLIFYPYSVYK